MNSINFAFIIPADSWSDTCSTCQEEWNDSKQTAEDARRIRAAHYDCHGWTHCEVECCGPCPTCGWCDGVEEYFDNPVRFDETLHRLVEMTDEEVEEAKKYIPADLEDADEIDWSFDEAFERSR